MSVILVSRHQGAVEWIRQQGFQVDRQCVHLDPESIAAGDVVVGTLPIQLAARVCEKGAEYWHLEIDVPLALRGKELTCGQLQALKAKLVPYQVQRVKM